jgi:N-acyl homoserine lactone hydrolase
MFVHALHWLCLTWLLAGVAACAKGEADVNAPSDSARTLRYPASHPPPDMTLSALLTGKMFARAGFAYSGGSFAEERVFSQGAILIRHPKGALLFDAGFGRNVDQHFLTTPWLMQKTARYERSKTAGEQLRRAGVDPKTLMAVVLTHAHWDHVSGLDDLPDVPVWVTRAELAFAHSDHDSMTLARQLGLSRYVAYDFESGPYLGFDESRDVFGDGSVVLVAAPGHTPGSIIAFVNMHDGKRYALIGDLAWQLEGIELPAPKPWPVRTRVDHDGEATRRMLEKVHALERSLPNLTVVPAHDQRVWDKLPPLVNSVR